MAPSKAYSIENQSIAQRVAYTKGTFLKSGLSKFSNSQGDQPSITMPQEPSCSETPTVNDTGSLVELPELPPFTRWLLLGLGSLLFGIGLICLALPIVPQAIPLGVGIALITLGSRTAHRLVHRALSRWPRLHAMVAKMQRRLHSWFSRS